MIRQPIDFLGVNYYTRSVTRFDPQAFPVRATGVRQRHATHTETQWEVIPRALTDTLVWVKDRYGNPPVCITENGSAFYDPPTLERDVLHDPLRVDYLQRHLRAAHDAIRAGCNLRGYFAWSLLDNFEWAHGFTKRFGIVHVDFETQRRTPKASAHYYTKVIATDGGVIDEPPV